MRLRRCATANYPPVTAPHSRSTDRAQVPSRGERQVMATAKRSGAAALPVRPGEKPWTEAELDKVRAELLAEIEELRTNIGQAESEIAERLGDAVGGAGDDQADAGAKTFQREYDLSLTQNARDLLDLTRSALARIDDGSYGVCASCGEPIGKARLKAFPRATLCVTCKQREERR